MNLFEKIRELKFPFIAVVAALTFGGLVAPANAAAPNITSPGVTVSAITASQARLEVLVDEPSANCKGAVRLGSNPTAPTAGQVIAATNPYAGDEKSSTSMPGAGTGTAAGTITGLAASTTYIAYVACWNGMGNSAVVSSAPFTTLAVLPPVVATPNAVNVQNTSALITVTTTGSAPSCRAGIHLASNSSVPSAADIRLNIGGFVTRISLDNMGGRYEGTATGLTAGTAYVAYTMCGTPSEGDSNVTSRAFTTTGGAPQQQQQGSTPSNPAPAFTINSRPAVSANGQMLTLNGENLGDVTGVKVAGKDAKISKKANGELVIEVPAGTEGFPDVEVIHAGGTVSMQGLIQVIKPYAQVRTQTITQFVGNRPTLAGIAALEQAYLAGTTANVLTCVATVASDASSATIAKATARAEATCGRIVKYAKYIKAADVHISKDGAAGSKPVLAVTFDRTLGGK